MGSMAEDNPWAVEKWEQFLYFCCPECDEKNQSKDVFIQHALNEHPNAKIRDKQKYRKPTISGHFNKDSGIFVVVWRTFTVSAKFYLTFYYRIKYINGAELPRLYHEDILRPYST